jgi:DNA invertase Pin-like site-specific DNA recombinase
MDKKLFVYGYCRVSTEMQAASGMGLEAQKEAIRRYYDYMLAPKGYLWGDFWIDPAVSGSVPFQQRNAGGELSLKMKAGDMLVVMKVDRAFRGFFDAVNQMEEWDNRGVGIYFLDLNLDTSSAVGKAVFRVMAAFAELERSRLRERIVEANRQRRLANRPLCQHVAYGYKIVGPKGKRCKAVDTYETRWGRKIVEMKDFQCMTFEEIWRWLRFNHIADRRGKEWSFHKVYRVYREFKRRQMEGEIPLQPPTETP